ncbi:MAG: glycosyltransferase [Myxococcota bacterium]
MTPVDVQRRFRTEPGDLYRLFMFVGLLFLGLTHLPNAIYDVANSRIIATLTMLGVWRYCWWLVHLVRAQLYARFVFPRYRSQCEAIWQGGWRPRRVVYMLTTFREKRETTEKVLGSIVEEARTSGIPTWIFFGTSDRSDEVIVEDFLQHAARNIDVKLVFIRQNLPGKRVAIGLTLRAMCRYNIHPDDLIFFMDGDTYMEPGILRRCLPLFHLFPKLDAVTTDERAELVGPRWMLDWTNMRFAQRHLAMQSQALSRKVLTLTGRLSVFRAHNVLSERFIRMVESDYLDHWLWGRYRFLSGDDKSTVYALLSKPGSAMMLYVPDAVCCTIEHVEGGGLERTKQNLLRWSGNLLRNGRRCIALGPHHIGLFIWWCFMDQQIAMWTTLAGPFASITLAILDGPWVLVATVLWILSTRLVLSLVLFIYNGRINIWYPVLLYFNQILNAGVKVYIIFRLSRQRWRNRGDQKSEGSSGWLATWQSLMANYMTAFYLGLFVLAVGAYFRLLVLPDPRVMLRMLGMG